MTDVGLGAECGWHLRHQPHRARGRQRVPSDSGDRVLSKLTRFVTRQQAQCTVPNPSRPTAMCSLGNIVTPTV